MKSPRSKPRKDPPKLPEPVILRRVGKTDKWSPVPDASDAPPPARPIGNLPKPLPQGGLDALLWSWFERWVSNRHQSVVRDWEAISDKRRFFVDLVLCAIFDHRSGEARPHRERAKSTSPEIFRRALPVLRRRIKKIKPDDYLAVIHNPNAWGKDSKLTPRQYDKRAKVRKGLETLPDFLRSRTMP
jgi:hypothetical protein